MFKKAEKVRTPQEKITCFAEAFEVVIGTINDSSQKKEEEESDFNTKLLYYFLYKAMPTQMVSTIKYFIIFLKYAQLY